MIGKDYVRLLAASQLSKQASTKIQELGSA